MTPLNATENETTMWFTKAPHAVGTRNRAFQPRSCTTPSFRADLPVCTKEGAATWSWPPFKEIEQKIPQMLCSFTIQHKGERHLHSTQGILHTVCGNQLLTNSKENLISLPAGWLLLSLS